MRATTKAAAMATGKQTKNHQHFGSHNFEPCNISCHTEIHKFHTRVTRTVCCVQTQFPWTWTHFNGTWMDQYVHRWSNVPSIQIGNQPTNIDLSFAEFN